MPRTRVLSGPDYRRVGATDDESSDVVRSGRFIASSDSQNR